MNVLEKNIFVLVNSRIKVLYLRIKELETNWDGGCIQNWAMIRNQQLIHDELKDGVLKYLE